VSQPPPGPPPAGPPSPPPIPPTPPAWGGPPPGTIYPGSGASAPTTSGLAIASLVTGLFFWCWAIPGIVAIVLGHIALEQIEDSDGVKRGKGMAIAGIVLGWVGIGIVGLLVLAWFINVLTI
jgi:Domain of unknown function (DUF4190)